MDYLNYLKDNHDVIKNWFSYRYGKYKNNGETYRETYNYLYIMYAC